MAVTHLITVEDLHHCLILPLLILHVVTHPPPLLLCVLSRLSLCGHIFFSLTLECYTFVHVSVFVLSDVVSGGALDDTVSLV